MWFVLLDLPYTRYSLENWCSSFFLLISWLLWPCSESTVVVSTIGWFIFLWKDDLKQCSILVKVVVVFSFNNNATIFEVVMLHYLVPEYLKFRELIPSELNIWNIFQTTIYKKHDQNILYKIRTKLTCKSKIPYKSLIELRGIRKLWKGKYKRFPRKSKETHDPQVWLNLPLDQLYIHSATCRE